MFYSVNNLFLREINLTFCFACVAMGP